jgi:5-methylcytosine-specific restriction endonuclease McrA
MGQYAELYNTKAWRRRRMQQLRQRPLCQQCANVHHRVTAATIAHHVVPHNGDIDSFYRGELMSLCAQCHDQDMQSLEKGGQLRQTIGIDGWPIDQ